MLYQTLTMDFEDQNGDIDGLGTGNERVYIPHVGYKADNDPVSVPLDSSIQYRAYYQQGSGLYGALERHVRGIRRLRGSSALPHSDHGLRGSKRRPCGSRNERVYIDHVGYKADDEAVIVPQDGTIYYRAYFQQGSGLYGPKLDELMDDDESLLVSFWRIFFKVIYSDDGELVDGARTYVNHVGYVSNNGKAVVPFESTIAHKANLGSVWSSHMRNWWTERSRSSFTNGTERPSANRYTKTSKSRKSRYSEEIC